jgi:hypothetical protein
VQNSVPGSDAEEFRRQLLEKKMPGRSLRTASQLLGRASALGATVSPRDGDRAKLISQFKYFTPNAVNFRRNPNSASAHCIVSCGNIDRYFFKRFPK